MILLCCLMCLCLTSKHSAQKSEVKLHSSSFEREAFGICFILNLNVQSMIVLCWTWRTWEDQGAGQKEDMNIGWQQQPSPRDARFWSTPMNTAAFFMLHSELQREKAHLLCRCIASEWKEKFTGKNPQLNWTAD